MKCPKCGAWNQAWLPKCVKCGMPLPEEAPEKAAWEDALHEKKPSLRILRYEAGEDPDTRPEEAPPYDPEAFDPENLTDEIESLERRREAGGQRLKALQEQVTEAQRAIRETEVIRPRTEEEAGPPPAPPVRKAPPRRARRAEAEPEDEGSVFPVSRPQRRPRTQTAAPYRLDNADPDALPYHDGYAPDDAFDEGGSAAQRTARTSSEDNPVTKENERRKKRSAAMRRFLFVLGFLFMAALFAVGGILGARHFVSRRGQQVLRDGEASCEWYATVTEDGFPAHTIVVRGRENASVYIQEMASTYVIADGNVTLTIPDYMWYDTDSSTYAVPCETDTADITVSPFIRYSASGEQYALEPVHFTIEVPISPVYLLNPATPRAEVGVSIFEVRLNVLAGSTVIIDGTNVSTLIRETGNVSKNVQVLPVGDNAISISVKSKFYRENKMEVVLVRAPQEIPLELVPTVITEWNYEADDPLHQTTISGTTLPGATITVESPHEDLTVNSETGEFQFKPLFPVLGNNDVVIRASFEGRADSVITHTVYFMPTADVYTRRAWDLDSQYSDLINYMDLRKRNGTIYVGTGVIKRIISTAPQMAVMDIGTEHFEKLVLLENSSKTTWTIGTRYRIYGEAFGLYDTMPRLTVRYTYLME